MTGAGCVKPGFPCGVSAGQTQGHQTDAVRNRGGLLKGPFDEASFQKTLDAIHRGGRPPTPVRDSSPTGRRNSASNNCSSSTNNNNNKKRSVTKRLKVFIRDIMDLNLDNSTLNFRWSEREVYWASFSHKSKLETAEHLFYKGFLNGKGARQGDRCLVRVKKDDYGEENYWQQYFRIVNVMHQITDLFNKSVLNNNFFSVIMPHLAQIDNVSSFNKICTWNGLKEFGREEFVVVEEYLSDSLEEFMCNNVSSRLMAIFEALSHFSFIVMHGELILCNFRGEMRDKECYLSCPTVHSRKQEFRDWGDEGISGIKNFLSKHKCNKLCRKFCSNCDNVLIEQMEKSQYYHDYK